MDECERYCLTAILPLQQTLSSKIPSNEFTPENSMLISRVGFSLFEARMFYFLERLYVYFYFSLPLSLWYR